MGVLSDIMTGVFSKISGTTPSLGTITWPNIPFSGAPPYLRVHILPATTEAIGIKSGDHHRGIIQVDCVIRDGIGPTTAATLADGVIAAFARNTTATSGTTTIRFNKTGSAGPGQQESDRYFIPVTIPYEVIA